MINPEISQKMILEYCHNHSEQNSSLTMELENMSCKEFSSVIGLNTDKEINNMVKNGEEIGERLVKFPFLRGKVEEELKIF